MAEIDEKIVLEPAALAWLLARLKKIDDKVSSYPSFTAAQLKDGLTYGFLNGQLEAIAGVDEDIITDAKITATTLALEALEKGVMPTGYDAEMYEQVRELLGDEIFDELLANSIQTFPEITELTDAEKIEQAKASYLERKTERLKEAEQAEAVESQETGSLDVERDKTI